MAVTTAAKMGSPAPISPETRALLQVFGAVIGSMSLVLQLAERVDSLRVFFRSYKDAPREIVEMGDCLQSLRDHLDELRKSCPVPSPGFTRTIERCKRCITPLEDLVEKLKPQLRSSQSLVQSWARIYTTQQATKIKKLREALAEAKLDLILTIQEAHFHQFQTLSDTLATLKLEQSTSTTLNADGEDQWSAVNAHLAEIKAQVSTLQDTFPDWDNGFQLPLVKQGMNVMVQQVLQSVLNSDELKQVMDNLVSGCLHQHASSATTSDDARQDEKTTSPVGKTMKGMRKSYVMRLSRNASSWKWNTWFGTLHYRSRVVSTVAEGNDYVQPQTELQTSWTIVPSKWLFSTAYTYQTTKSTQGWTYKIQPHHVVPGSSPIFAYAEAGDVEGIQSLLQSKTASPNDCDDQGYTALHRAAALRHDDVCRLLIQNGANVNVAGFISGETPLHQMPLNRSRVSSAKLFDTVQVLVRAGADLGLENKRHQTVTDMFESFFRWPSRTALRQDVAKSHGWLEGNAWDLELRNKAREDIVGKLYSGMDVNSEVEALDACLRPDSNPKTALAGCPRSIVSGWTALHVMMHFRVEPVWHPWSKGSIFQQKDLWTRAMSRAIEQGIDPHTADLEGHTPTSLALRSLFTFHVWQKAVVSHGFDLDDFVRQELSVCAPLRRDGWTHASLVYLLSTPTETLYLHGPAWREVSEFFSFQDATHDGLYLRSCWFQLLDLLKHQCLLPKGWETLTLPRRFAMSRDVKYWHKDQRALVEERPQGGAVIEIERLEGKDLVSELAQLGVVWQG